MKLRMLSLALSAALVGAGVPVAHATDLQSLISRASGGDSAAMVEVGEQLLARGEAVQAIVYLENVVRLGRPEEDVARAHVALAGHYMSLQNNPMARQTAIVHYQQAAALGHVQAQLNLGRIYLTDAKALNGAERDKMLDRALLLLQHAAAQAQNLDAAYLLGNAFLYGNGFKRDQEVGVAWLKFAADRGHRDAALAAGRHELAQRRGQTAEHYLALAAHAGSGSAAMALADGYATGRVIPKNTEYALGWARYAASLGISEANQLVARLAPTQRQPAPAATYTASAPSYAAATAAAAQTAYAVQANLPGATGAASAEDARLRQLEEQNAQLQRQLQLLMQQLQGGAAPAGTQMLNASYGTTSPAVTPAVQARTTAGITQPATQAIAAPPAPVQPPAATVAALDEDYVADQPTPRKRELSPNERGLNEHALGNYGSAARHFTRAVRAGDADAMNNLGMLYLQGQGVEQDRDRAMQLFRQAAEQGHAVAARNIAYMYQYGVGVRQDLARANIWVKHANNLDRRAQGNSRYARL